MNIKREIKKLQNQIQKLEEKQISINQKKVLPYIQSANCVLHYQGNFYGVRVTCLNKEAEEKLYNFISGRQDSWGNHMGYLIADGIYARYDDGSFTLSIFKAGHTPEQSREFFIKSIKKLMFKVDFTREKALINEEINNKQQKIVEINELEKIFK